MEAKENFVIRANILDVLQRKMGFGEVEVSQGSIRAVSMKEAPQDGALWVMPGFIDGHIHIESSMLTPPAFARMAVKHGTVATISDPHEIANVCGINGVRYMVDLGARSGFKFFFGAPSCVPATAFETAGATLDLKDIRALFEDKSVWYLSEMMNYPAVLSRDPLVMDKIELTREFNLPVDGHAPGLRGKEARLYASAGITTDHECTSLDEALDKIAAGMSIIIREGSAAKNYTALHPLISSHPEKVMFCSDDKHPDDLAHGHINQLVTRSLGNGHDVFDILSIACVNPVKHYGIPVGLLQPGDPADMIMVKDLESFEVISTWIAGIPVFSENLVTLPDIHIPIINSFSTGSIRVSDIKLNLHSGPAHIIEAVDGAIVTGHKVALMEAGPFESDTERDILKLVVVNRYSEAPPAIALIRGFGLKSGAIATSVAHDSHNIIAVGTSDADLAACINAVIDARGGLCALGRMKDIPPDIGPPMMASFELDNMAFTQLCVPLPVGGLMSDTHDGETIGKLYTAVDMISKTWLGSTLSAPFMTLSFMALLVIPSLKLSDKGLFDSEVFRFTALQE